MITLKRENQTAIVDKGELVGYQVNEHEFIHQKGSPGWGSSDAEMFPIIGPVDESNFLVQVPKGNAIQDQHGLLRQFEYDLVEHTGTRAVFKKTYKAGTPIKNSKYPEKSTKQWMVWPYSFEFTKTVELVEGGLEVIFTVSGERDMPFMLGYHPAFKLHTENPIISTGKQDIGLKEVMAVGSRALQVPDCESIVLKDEKTLTINTEGFGHFMCWTEVPNMVCIEPISFYPYAVAQQNLHEGFQYLLNETMFKVSLLPEL